MYFENIVFRPAGNKRNNVKNRISLFENISNSNDVQVEPKRPHSFAVCQVSFSIFFVLLIEIQEIGS